MQRFAFALPLVVFAAVALYIMVQTSPLITFAVFLPLALIMVTVSVATRVAAALSHRQPGVDG